MDDEDRDDQNAADVDRVKELAREAGIPTEKAAELLNEASETGVRVSDLDPEDLQTT